MTGDLADMRQRLRMTLPSRWFSDTTPILDSLLSGFASAWIRIYDLLQLVIIQSRVNTATGQFLDLAAADFLDTFPRRPHEKDEDFRLRLIAAMKRIRATRPAIVAAAAAAGYTVAIFEAAQPADTGAYNVPINLAWNSIGGWGSLQMPFEALIVAQPQDAAFESELWANIANAAPAGGALWMRVAVKA